MKKFFYRVREGDNLYSLSKKFKTPVGILIYENKLNKEIEEGDVLYVFVPSGTVYTATPLDDYCSISKKFGLTEEELKEKNKTPYLYYGVLIVV